METTIMGYIWGLSVLVSGNFQVQDKVTGRKVCDLEHAQVLGLLMRNLVRTSSHTFKSDGCTAASLLKPAEASYVRSPSHR